MYKTSSKGTALCLANTGLSKSRASNFRAKVASAPAALPAPPYQTRTSVLCIFSYFLSLSWHPPQRVHPHRSWTRRSAQQRVRVLGGYSASCRRSQIIIWIGHPPSDTISNTVAFSTMFYREIAALAISLALDGEGLLQATSHTS